jgi:hypothetical protein
MSRFDNIDSKLISFASKLNATFKKDRPGYPEALRTFEERRIDWVEGQIRKAIIIQPTFEASGVNSSIWNLINLAWVERNGIPVLPAWKVVLIEKSDFRKIEDNIDELLIQSESNLKKIEIDDVM